jgi:hypothetical protein
MAEGRDLTREEYEHYIKLEQSGNHRAVRAVRAVGHGLEDEDLVMRGGPITKIRGDIGLPMIRSEETSLMKVLVGDREDADKLWLQACENVLKLNNVDPMVLQKSKKTIGNYYQNGSFCEFLMALYHVRDSEQHVLDFKRMSGDGFVMDAFYRQMKEPLDQTGKTLNPGTDTDGQTDVDDDEDMFDEYSSDEDEDETDVDEEFLRPGGYLKLAADKNLVVHWMNQVKTRHIEDQNHMMGLMAHNSELEENRKIMLGHLSEMLKMIILKLLQTANAALVRNASVLLHNLMLNVTAETFPADQKDQLVQAIFQCIQKWVPQEYKGDHLAPVSQSRETVKYLSMAVASLLRNKVFTSEEMTASREAMAQDEAVAVVNVLQFLSKMADDWLPEEAKVQAPLLSEAATFFAATTSK